MADDENEPPARPLLERPLFKYVFAPLIVLVVGAVLVTSLTGGDVDKPASNVPAQTPSTEGRVTEAPKPPKNAIEQIARRDIWTTIPETFKSGQAILEGDPYGDNVPLDIDTETLQPTVVTPHQLALHGSEFEGQDVLLVGRVIDDVSLTPPEVGEVGLDHETRLAGSRTSGVYAGSYLKVPPERGETVWVIGRVAAVGRAETLSGRQLRAAYFIASGGFNSTGFGDKGLPGSVRDAVRVQAKRRLQPS